VCLSSHRVSHRVNHRVSILAHSDCSLLFIFIYIKISSLFYFILFYFILFYFILFLFYFLSLLPPASQPYILLPISLYSRADYLFLGCVLVSALVSSSLLYRWKRFMFFIIITTSASAASEGGINKYPVFLTTIWDMAKRYSASVITQLPLKVNCTNFIYVTSIVGLLA
jgi:hypothetical protein